MCCDGYGSDYDKLKGEILLAKKAKKREYHRKNRAKLNSNQRAYREKNRAKVNESKRTYRETNKAQIKDYNLREWFLTFLSIL